MLSENAFFTSNAPRFRSSAPGRLDVLGGFADIAGALVLQTPIREKTTVTLALRHDHQLRIYSRSIMGDPPQFVVDYQRLLTNETVDYARVREIMLQLPGGTWARYVIGCFLQFQTEKGVPVTGADVYVDSTIPMGRGVASSAALGVATLKALAEAYGISLSGTELPMIAQRAENAVTGNVYPPTAALTAYLAEPNALLPVLCQPDGVPPVISLPDGVRFVGIDSGAKLLIGGTTFADVRTALFIGYTIIAKQCGATDAELRHACDTGDWSALPYAGYWAAIPPADLEEKFATKLPYKMSGHYVRDAFPVHPDPGSNVQSDKFYSVLACTRQAVYEHFRTHLFISLLHYASRTTDSSQRENCLRQLGELMYQSHAGYSACGLGHVKTDELVQAAKARRADGIYGARVTGQGGGGTICVLCDGERGVAAARNLFETYREKHQADAVFFE